MLIMALFVVIVMVALCLLVGGFLLVFSTLSVSASPLVFSIMMALNPKFGGFFVNFAFWFILVYSLSSYKKLRKAIVFSATSLLGGGVASLMLILLEGYLPESMGGIFLIKFIITLGFIIVGLMVDNEKEMIFCINIARFVRLPKIVERLIAAYVYAIGISALLILSLPKMTSDSILFGVLKEWVVPLLIGAIAFYIDGVNDGDFADKGGYIRRFKECIGKIRQVVRTYTSAEKIAEIKEKFFTSHED